MRFIIRYKKAMNRINQAERRVQLRLFSMGIYRMMVDSGFYILFD